MLRYTGFQPPLPGRLQQPLQRVLGAFQRRLPTRPTPLAQVAREAASGAPVRSPVIVQRGRCRCRRAVAGQALDCGDDSRQLPPVPVDPDERRNGSFLAADMARVVTLHIEHSLHRCRIDELLEAVRQAVCHGSRLPVDVDEPVVENPGAAPRWLHGDGADFLQHFAFHVHGQPVPILAELVPGGEQVGDR
jgi:hypothetical protein